MDTIADLNNKLRTFGYVVLRNVIDKDAILRCRRMLSSSLPRVDRFVSHFSNPDELPLAKDLGYELFYGEKIKDVLGGLLEAHGVAILPPFEVMQNHFATHSWHRDSGGERSLDLNCSDLTDPNYRLGKIAIFLQSDTRHFGGSIEVIPYSHRLAGSTKNTLRYWRMGDFLAHILNLAPKVQLRRQLLVRILRRFIVRNLKFRAGDVVLFDSRLLHSSLPTSEATKVKFQSSVREDEILLADQDKKLAIYVQYGNSLAFRSYLRYRLQDSNYPGVDNAELFQHPIRPFIGVDDGAYFDYLSMAHETKEWKR